MLYDWEKLRDKVDKTVGALHDTIHREVGNSRAARSAKVPRQEEQPLHPFVHYTSLIGVGTLTAIVMLVLLDLLF